MAFDSNGLDDYVDVAARIVDFRTKHPEGSLQPANLDEPFTVVTIGPDTFVVVVAAAYRTPDDPRPGIGMAYEPCPGRTPYTKASELQNAETAAWGRAIVATLAADTKRGVASKDEVRNRQADREQPEPAPAKKRPTVQQNTAYVALDGRIDNANTAEDLKATWEAIVAAHRTGDITDDQGNRLRATLESRRVGLGEAKFDESSGKGVGVAS